jgi:hypothetical protein
MICDAPAVPPQPPSWTMTVAGNPDAQLLLGFFTFGTEAQLTKVASAVRAAGLLCEVQAEGAGARQMLVLFGRSTTRDAAFAFYNRVACGEFGTTNHRLILVPAKEAQQR